MTASERLAKYEQLVREQSDPRPVAAAGLAIGITGMAWGGPRLRMVGDLIDHGRKHGPTGGTRAAAVVAESARRALLTGTAPLGRVGSIPPLSRVGRKIPGPLRPAAAVGAGALLASRSVPVTQKTYEPVRGW